jgi:hypothetical protein
MGHTHISTWQDAVAANDLARLEGNTKKVKKDKIKIKVEPKPKLTKPAVKRKKPTRQ